MIELWGSFLSIVCNVLAAWTVLMLFDSFFTRRIRGKKYWLCALCRFLLATVISLTIHGQIVLQMPLELLLEFGFCMLMYHSRWDKCFFIIAALYAVVSSFHYWSNRLLMAAFALSYEEYVWNIPLYSASMLGRALLLVLLAALIKRFHRPLPESGRPHLWLSLSCAFPFLTLLILLKASVPAPEQPIWQFFLAVLDLVNLLALFLLDYMERAAFEREQLVAAGERARVQDENVRALSAAYGAQRKMTHDFRAHLATLAELHEQGKWEDARQYLAELRVRTTERILLVNSHNAAIDAVLNQKGYAGQRSGIDMRFHVNDLSPLRLPATDVTVVLGNLLDNAIEACAGFPEGKRWVDVRLLYQTQNDSPLLFLKVTNPSRPVCIENNRIATSKKDAMLHGFGLQNVQDILKRYNAEYFIHCGNGRFIFQCSWPDEK